MKRFSWLLLILVAARPSLAATISAAVPANKAFGRSWLNTQDLAAADNLLNGATINAPNFTGETEIEEAVIDDLTLANGTAGQVIKLDDSFKPVAATQGVDFALPAPIVSIHADGTQTYYGDADDTAAQRGTALIAAQSAAASGDTIVAGPAAYTVTSRLGKTGVSYAFQPGAVVTGNITGVNACLWGDGGSATSFTVVGGSFDTASAFNGCETFRVSNAGSTIVFSPQSIDNHDNDSGDPGAAAVRVLAGNVTIAATEKIKSTYYDALWLTGGVTDIRGPVIDGADEAVEIYGGTHHIFANAYKSGANGSGLQLNGGNYYISGDSLTCANVGTSAATVIDQSAGTTSDAIIAIRNFNWYVSYGGGGARLQDCRIGTTSNNVAPVTLTANGLTLQGCSTLSHASVTNCVTAGSAKTLTVVGGLAVDKAISSNVTITYSSKVGDSAKLGGASPTATFLGLVDDTFSANVLSILGAADYSAVRTLLALVPGTNVQAFDSDLALWAAITPGTGVGAAAANPVDASGGFATWDAELSALRGLTSAADQVPTWTGSGTAANVAKNVYTASMVTLNSGQGGLPSDSTAYYFGNQPSVQMTTADGVYGRFYFPFACKITKAYLSFVVTATTTTAETFTTSVRVNSTTDYTISAACKMDATRQMFSNTSLNSGSFITIAAGDYIEVKVMTPAWATNPGTVYGSCVLEIQAQ